MTNREINIKNHKLIKAFRFRSVVSESVLLLIFSFFMAFLRPFGMDEISLAYAWLFWVVVCFCGFTIYSPIITYGNNFLIQYLPNKLNKYWLRVAIATFVASIVMAFVVPLIIILFFDISMSYFQSIPQHFIAGLFIGGIITFILTVYDLYQEQKAIVVQQKVELVNQQKSGNDRQSPLVKKFMAKLPVAIRGDLLCLQMDDHYLNVYTDKGKHLLLMRFKDALAMLEEYPGLQTHRSWWVAHQAIIGSKKDGRKLILKLKGDIEAPVSNTYLTKVKSLL